MLFIEILELSKDCRNCNSGESMNVNKPERKKQNYKRNSKKKQNYKITKGVLEFNLFKMCSCRTSQNPGVLVLRICFYLIFSPVHSANASDCAGVRNGCCLFSFPWKELLIPSVILK